MQGAATREDLQHKQWKRALEGFLASHAKQSYSDVDALSNRVAAIRRFEQPRCESGREALFNLRFQGRYGINSAGELVGIELVLTRQTLVSVILHRQRAQNYACHFEH